MTVRSMTDRSQPKIHRLIKRSVVIKNSVLEWMSGHSRQAGRNSGGSLVISSWMHRSGAMLYGPIDGRIPGTDRTGHYQDLTTCLHPVPCLDHNILPVL